MTPARAECIVNLAELPMQITTCLEAINDLNHLFNNIDNSGNYLAHHERVLTHLIRR